MIKANKGSVKLNGTGKQLIADYAVIGIKLRQIFPAEVVDAAVEISKEPIDKIKEKIKEKFNAEI